MSAEHRTQHALNAAVGTGLAAGGQRLGTVIRRRGYLEAKVAGAIVPRGMKAVGVPLAATGLVGATRGHEPADKVDLRDLSRNVAHQTLAMPKLRPKTTRTQSAKDVTAATLGGAVTGMGVGRALRKHPHGGAISTAATIGTASGILYGRQKHREHQRAHDRAERLAAVAKKAAQRTITMPAPSVNDTVEDWKLLRQRKRTANTSIAAAGVGAAAFAARSPHLVKPKNPSPKLIKLRAHSTRVSEGLGAAAVGAGLYSAATGYRTQRHDLAVQRRRLVERDRALQGKKPTAPVAKDAFTRKYGDRISPGAEQGYEYLRRGRNRQARRAGLSTALTAINAHSALRGGKVMRPVSAGLGVLTATDAVRNARGAARWNGHMAKIKAKAYERAAQGVYGVGREPVKADLAKALVRVRPPGLPLPKGLARRPSMHAGGVRRTASGKLAVFRGSYG